MFASSTILPVLTSTPCRAATRTSDCLPSCQKDKRLRLKKRDIITVHKILSESQQDGKYGIIAEREKSNPIISKL